jgi:hypothetical protein
MVDIGVDPHRRLLTNISIISMLQRSMRCFSDLVEVTPLRRVISTYIAWINQKTDYCQVFANDRKISEM